MTRLYDQEKDRESFSFQLGLPIHCGRLAAAVETLLAHPDSEIIRVFARVELDNFKRWADENGILTALAPLDIVEEPHEQPVVMALRDAKAAYDRRYPFGVDA